MFNAEQEPRGRYESLNAKSLAKARTPAPKESFENDAKNIKKFFVKQ